MPPDLLTRAGTAPLLLTPREELERWLTPPEGTASVFVYGGTAAPAGRHDGDHGHGQASTLDLGSLHALNSVDLGNIIEAVHAVHHSVDAGHAGGGHGAMGEADTGGGGHG